MTDLTIVDEIHNWPVHSRLKLARFRAGLTQHQLAERALVTRGTVARIEGGEHKPRLLTARALESVLGLDEGALRS